MRSLRSLLSLNPVFAYRMKARFLLLSLAVLVADQWSKWLIEVHLPHHAVHPLVPGLLNLAHVRNTGIAFGLFAAGPGSRGTWSLSLLVLTVSGLVFLYFLYTHHRDRLLLGALSLIAGGALGNLFDRLGNGGVTDFLELHVGRVHWPAFNVADAAIAAGIFLMALDVLRPRPVLPPLGSEPTVEEPPVR